MNKSIPLQQPWIWYFHDPHSNNWSKESYGYIGKVRTLQEYVVTERTVSPYLPYAMFFFVRNNTFPSWDDESNRYGGVFNIKVGKQDVPQVWEDVMNRVLSNALWSEEHAENHAMVTGVSISPKKYFCILKIWVSGKPTASIDTTNMCIHGEVMFKTHHP